MPTLARKLVTLLIAAWTAAALALPSGLAFELCSCGADLTVCEIEAAPNCCDTSCCDEDGGGSRRAAPVATGHGECAPCTRVVTGDRETLGTAGERGTQRVPIDATCAHAPSGAPTFARALAPALRPPEIRPPPRSKLHRPLLI